MNSIPNDIQNDILRRVSERDGRALASVNASGKRGRDLVGAVLKERRTLCGAYVTFDVSEITRMPKHHIITNLCRCGFAVGWHVDDQGTPFLRVFTLTEHADRISVIQWRHRFTHQGGELHSDTLQGTLNHVRRDPRATMMTTLDNDACLDFRLSFVPQRHICQIVCTLLDIQNIVDRSVHITHKLWKGDAQSVEGISFCSNYSIVYIHDEDGGYIAHHYANSRESVRTPNNSLSMRRACYSSLAWFRDTDFQESHTFSLPTLIAHQNLIRDVLNRILVKPR